jgi:hypothetical protein
VHRSGLAARAAGLLDAAAPGGSLERGSAAARPMLRAPAAAIFRTCSSTFVILVLNNKFKTGTNFSECIFLFFHFISQKSFSKRHMP